MFDYGVENYRSGRPPKAQVHQEGADDASENRFTCSSPEVLKVHNLQSR